MTIRGRRNNNRVGKLCIGIAVFSFVVVMSIQIFRVYEKDLEYKERQEELEAQLQEETDRQKELEELETYTKSDEYVEDVAKSKLGLAYDNEIIFKETE